MIRWLFKFNSFSGAKGNPVLTDIGLLVLRVFIGLFIAFGHGILKIQNYDQMSTQFLHFLGLSSTISLSLSIFAEFFMALFLVIGLLTRFALIPLIINMSTALILVHLHMTFDKKELALLYLVPFLALLIAGPGRFSLDALFAGIGASKRKAEN